MRDFTEVGHEFVVVWINRSQDVLQWRLLRITRHCVAVAALANSTNEFFGCMKYWVFLTG